MLRGAPRLARRLWQYRVRRAALALALCLCLVGVGRAFACFVSPLQAEGVVQSSVEKLGEVTAWYADLTDRYPHGALGDVFEPTSLHVLTPQSAPQCGLRLTLGTAHVFEDTAPRLADLDGDGRPEVITIRSHRSKGAQLAIYRIGADKITLAATTPYIGTRFRWLAPVAIADLDEDGHMEIAYIDRPHLAKRLRVWRFSNGALHHVADRERLTNHRFGESRILGGLRRCTGARPELITADTNWRNLVVTTLDGGQLSSRRLAPFSEAALKHALACRT